MRNRSLLVILGLFFMVNAFAQREELTYYLPNITYDEAIPTPEEFLGWQIGEWHLTHDLQRAYLQKLADVSDRITLTEYARSHEQKPLLYLTITSPENHAQLPELQAEHVALSDPEKAKDVDLKNAPVVVYQAYNIHGNEPSGGNAAVLIAYYLAAGQDAMVNEILDNTIILLDPCLNPDGFQRFSTWANEHKNLTLTADPQDREYTESWPRGRTNHYWFDLNRDWLLVQHPESRGRIKAFHDWKPNILTDHHEMGTNATFFFMPGEPTRVHPITPAKNQALTEAIGNFHAEALDDIASLYYSKEGYDDYYIGKGSTYPDVNGCIGILFEQASSRGHLQESDNGLLSFPFTIRNQVVTSLSTQKAAVNLREEILTFQRDFYQNAQREASAETRTGYVFGNDNDQQRTNHLIDILLHHEVEVYPLDADQTKNGTTYRKGEAYYVPLRQQQYRFVKAIFDPILEFTDSLFYDISTWTMPLAHNLPYAEVTSARIGDRLTEVPALDVKAPAKSEYAYLLPWNEFYAPRAAYHLLEAGLRLKVTTEASTVNGQEYGAGTVFLPVANQEMTSAEIHAKVQEVVTATEVAIIPVGTGLSSTGPDLGSRKYHTLQLPKVAVIVGDGITSYEAGSNWHLLDQRYRIPVTKLTTDRIARADLDRYNVIILPDGNYRLRDGGIAKLQDWVSAGGVLIAQKRANRFCNNHQLAELQMITPQNAKED
ncbi:MAG: M14 family metallopeptidase, partial [Bacteroidota bacterium]